MILAKNNLAKKLCPLPIACQQVASTACQPTLANVGRGPSMGSRRLRHKLQSHPALVPLIHKSPEKCYHAAVLNCP
jgi:hypothetical protein